MIKNLLNKELIARYRVEKGIDISVFDIPIPTPKEGINKYQLIYNMVSIAHRIYFLNNTIPKSHNFTKKMLHFISHCIYYGHNVDMAYDICIEKKLIVFTASNTNKSKYNEGRHKFRIFDRVDKHGVFYNFSEKKEGNKGRDLLPTKQTESILEFVNAIDVEEGLIPTYSISVVSRKHN